MVAIHLARLVEFEVLLDRLRENILNRSVYEVQKGDLSIFCYTNACVYNQMWNPWNTIARGLIIDRPHKTVIATPFPKFFNYKEQNITLPDSEFETYEKLDGSLGICYYYQDQWRFATKANFDSPQAQWAQDYLGNLNLTYLTPGTTYLFEIIYRANKIIVDYDYESLVLLSAYNLKGEELSRLELLGLADNLGVAIAQQFDFNTMASLVAKTHNLDKNTEGFVVKFPCGLRLKIKGKEYLQLHKIIAGITPSHVWELMKEGRDLEAIRSEIPEEYWGEYDRLCAGFEQQFAEIIQAVESYYIEYQDKSDKELGLMRESLPEIARNFIFERRKKGIKWHEETKTRNLIFNRFR